MNSNIHPGDYSCFMCSHILDVRDIVRVEDYSGGRLLIRGCYTGIAMWVNRDSYTQTHRKLSNEELFRFIIES